MTSWYHSMEFPYHCRLRYCVNQPFNEICKRKSTWTFPHKEFCGFVGMWRIFAQNLLIGPGSTWKGGLLALNTEKKVVGGGVDQQSTWKGSAKTLQGLPLTMLILGGWSTFNLERIHEDIARITSDTVDPGDWSMVNLERICKDIARITSDNVDPGGLINGQLGKDLQRHCKGYLWQCLWQCCSWGVDWWSTWNRYAKTLQGLPLTMLILGVNWWSTWKGSAKTL